ncbi:hypothetical protein Noda2021_03480 [Candidatus Dependentiae bacterium Noda2021]|nr:hypothetical protein Noda2021_03480 [Candidatus Dependentiae bacterium Noda2021]
MANQSWFKNLAYIAVLFFLFPLIPGLIEGMKKLYLRNFDTRTAVGVVPIKGTIYDSSSYVKQLNTFFKDQDIKAILLKMECPGGASGASQTVFNEILTLKKEHSKPVIAWVENMCASGGYYIAIAADHIVSSPSAIIGSIGVYSPFLFQLKDFLEYHKIKYAPVQAGYYKSATNPLQERTPEQTAMLQSLLDDTYNQFITDVAQQRKLPIENQKEWADGKIFTGKQALALGLIDTIGAHAEVVNAIKQKAMIEKDIRWVHPPVKGGLFASLSGEQKDTDDTSMVSHYVHQICSVLESRYGQQLIQ